ncbi:metal-sensing transcriptional repressor [Aminobacter sp. P9b]|uniref:metal-sensing transcriptional repressor n=1 Tax=Aminobacter sp. P9b TaxID=3133697 RepID=UPI00387790E5
MQPTASIRGSVSGLAVELIEDHIRNHVVDPADQKLARQAEGARQLIDVVRTYLK